MRKQRRRASSPDTAGRVKVLAEFRFRLRQFLRFSEEAAENAGISAQHYQLLQIVEAAPEGLPASVSYVAERMMLRHNSTVELIDRAELAGLVRRLEDGEDHRRAVVALTEEGRRLLSALVAQHWTELKTRGTELHAALEHLLGAIGTAKHRGGTP